MDTKNRMIQINVQQDNDWSRSHGYKMSNKRITQSDLLNWF